MPFSLFSLLAAPLLAASSFCAIGQGRSVNGTLATFKPAINVALAAGTPPIVAPGVSPVARARAELMLDEMLSQSPGAVAWRLKQGKVFLVIIPQDKKLTDLPEFKALRGVKLPDGRVWDDVRGVGLVSQDDGSVALGVGEENLRLDGVNDLYPKGHLLAHEFGHAVHAHGLSAPAFDEIKDSYEERKKKDLPFQSAYARSTVWEYFAVATSALFQLSLWDEHDEPWLAREDKTLRRLVGDALGAPRPAWR